MVTSRKNLKKTALAHQILSLARKHDWKQGHHLTESSLVALLKVSRSPIRSALQVLNDSGAVQARANHGYFLADDAANIIIDQQDAPSSMEEALYLKIVKDRFAGELPDFVTQIELMNRYKADRHLLLRVLSRISLEGLIERNLGRGWTFLPAITDLESQTASYEYRLLIEPNIPTLGSFKPDNSALLKSRDAHLQLIKQLHGSDHCSAAWIFELDADFHEMIARMSGNSFVLATIQQQNRMRRLMEYHSYTDIIRVEKWCNEHLAIIENLLEGNREATADMLYSHLSNALRALKKQRRDL